MTGREAQFERRGPGRCKGCWAQKGWERRQAGGGAKGKWPGTRAENSSALRWGPFGDGRRKAGWGSPRSDTRRSSADAPLNNGTRRKAQTRGRSQGQDRCQGNGRAAERPAPRTAAGATTESSRTAEAERLQSLSGVGRRLGQCKTKATSPWLASHTDCYSIF